MKIYITRKIPDLALSMLEKAGFEIDINQENRTLEKSELIEILSKKDYDCLLSLLTDKIDSEVFDSCKSLKIVSNYAVGFNNIDLDEAKKRNIIVTNTAGTLTDSVAEHTVALLLALTCRIVEGDRFTRDGKYKGFDPMLLLGEELEDKTVGILGAGRIGQKTAKILHHGFGMKVLYYDVLRNENFEKDCEAVFYESVDDVLKNSDVVCLAVPLLDSTRHLINKDRLKMMKKTAYLINTARGPVVDEKALVEALKNKTIAGAGLDVFENEPELADGLTDLENVVLTPHIASATTRARNEMAEIVANNLIDFNGGRSPRNKL
jgi:lactate dehydrogenase-like 2-hydroxyacid dehydrogenase